MSEASLAGSAAPGWFGKLPALGDFASRRLSAALVRDWDDWLQRGIAAAIEQHGRDWLRSVAGAPACRFHLGAGLRQRAAWAAGPAPHACVGLLLPSHDRVGRHFPLTLFAPAPALPATLAASGWFDAAEAALRRVFEDGFGLDDFERELAALPALDGTVGADLAESGSTWWRDGQPPRPFDGLPPGASFASLFGPPAFVR